MRPTTATATCVALALTVTGCAATRGPEGALSGQQLTDLTANGLTMDIGTPGTGFSGELELSADGTGEGYFDNPEGERTPLTGTWEVRDGQFCRVWAAVNNGEEVCEDWVPMDATSVAVLVDGRQIGVNSW